MTNKIPATAEVGDFIRSTEYRGGQSKITRKWWDGIMWSYELANGAILVQHELNTGNVLSLRNSRAMDALVKELAGIYPGLGLSFGYIGNVTRTDDDRSFRVFTKLHDTTGRSISHHLGDIDGLERACGAGGRMRVINFVTQLANKERK